MRQPNSFFLLLFAGLNLFSTPFAIGGSPVVVGTPTELIDALKKANASSPVIQLKPGNYGRLNLWGVKDTYARFAFPVTIESLDPLKPAEFSGLELMEVSNLQFHRLKFKYAFDGSQPDWNRMVSVGKSQSVSFLNNTFEGAIVKKSQQDLTKGNIATFATGIGVGISSCQNITVSGNKSYNFLRGFIFGQTKGLIVTGNDVLRMRSDGMDFAEVEDVLIERNSIHDFKTAEASGDHVDLIQFWTSGTEAPSKNIVIRNNFLNNRAGAGGQSIFMRNELVDQGLKGPDFNYKNILIEDNTIHNRHLHGITVGESDGLVIRNNTVLFNRGPDNSESSVNIPAINVNGPSTQVEVYKNVAESISLSPTAQILRSDGNLLVQHKFPLQPAFYGGLWVNPLAGIESRRADFAPIPGGYLELTETGARTYPLLNNRKIYRGQIEAMNLAGSGMLTASLSAFTYLGLTEQGPLNYRWNFGDGSPEIDGGANMNHTFPRSGYYTVTATPQGLPSPLVLRRTVLVESPIALYLPFDSGFQDQSDSPNAVNLQGGPVLQDGALVLPAKNAHVTYAQSAELLQNSDFTISFRYRNSTAGGEGRMVYFSGTAVLGLSGQTLYVMGSNDAGQSISLKTTQPQLADLNWHQVTYSYSQATGKAILYVDGTKVDEASGLTGKQYVANGHDFHVGSPFGDSFVGSIDEVKFVRWATSP